MLNQMKDLCLITGLLLLFGAQAVADDASTKSFPATKQGESKELKESIDRSKSGPRLELGGATSGSLTSSSERLPEDGSFVQRYLLSADPGTPVVIDLNSIDFDTYLIVQDLAGRWIDSNDDVQGSTDSRVALLMPSSGEVWVIANTYEAGETGRFEISAVHADQVEIPAFPDPSVIPANREIRGSFTNSSDRIWDDTYAATYLIPSTVSGRFSLTMGSNEFDPYVIVTDASGQVIAQDSAGAGGEVALSFSSTPGMPTFILANQVSRATGGYTLRVEEHTPATLPSGSNPDGNYALLVGVADYPGQSDDLPLVANDVVAMRKMLVEDLGYDPNYIYTLEDHDATRHNILGGISEFLGRAGPDGTAMFYFSGHGTRTQENVALVEPIDIEEDGVDEALVAYDQLIIDDEAGFAMRMLDAGHISAFYDTCHSGTGVRTDTAMPKFLKAADTHKMMPRSFIFGEYDIESMQASGHDLSGLDPRVAFFASSLDDELSWIANDVNMSLYTYYLTEMLPDYLSRSLGELENAMQPLVVGYSESNLGATQTPNAEGQTSRVKLREILGVNR